MDEKSKKKGKKHTESSIVRLYPYEISQKDTKQNRLQMFITLCEWSKSTVSPQLISRSV